MGRSNRQIKPMSLRQKAQFLSAIAVIEYKKKLRTGKKWRFKEYWRNKENAGESLGWESGHNAEMNKGKKYKNRKIATTNITPRSVLLDKEREIIVQHALAALTTQERQVVDFSFGWEGDALPIGKVALLLKIEETKAKAILKSALAKLSQNKQLQRYVNNPF
ncbi:MAG TPA: sigma-70 family RNA polymerase sigma factor [Candidatus Diapherotrites archaeon]|uniref:Sigma-70 family RNA polymerase sigma factor n=1 Tax=Candidatus Iainarchaeum sp. TaxID=3101447 RepID=A0A7J4IY56_9ARCH|nr:sigma-70 family RNA polymerase sigma factor [Candidatus Diapherotrites archaeon]